MNIGKSMDFVDSCYLIHGCNQLAAALGPRFLRRSDQKETEIGPLFQKESTAIASIGFLEATGLKGEVTCRFTHVYRDGPAPYFSFHALGRHGALLEQWQASDGF